jgi:hypothetical protein
VSFFGQMTRSLRRDGSRGPRYARRAARGTTLTLGSARVAEDGRPWRALVWGALALVLYRVESGLLAQLGPSVARVDLAVLLAVFAALELAAIEGVLTAFVVGYVADMFVLGPPGMCRFLAVGAWLGVRLVSARVHLSPLLAALLFTLGGAAAYQFGVLSLMELAAGRAEGPGTIAWLSVVPHAALTAAFAPLAFRLFGAIQARTGG